VAQAQKARKTLQKSKKGKEKAIVISSDEELSESDEDTSHDSEKDALMEIKLQRLKESGSNVPALWTTIPEFAGLTNATRSYSLWSKKN
jgi:hypothetical protein